MYEQLNSAFDVERPNSIQYSGPITQTLDHGVSHMMGPCTHPDHAGQVALFFATMLIPMIIMRQQGGRWFDVCYICHLGYELENQMAHALLFQ